MAILRKGVGDGEIKTKMSRKVFYLDDTRVNECGLASSGTRRLEWNLVDLLVRVCTGQKQTSTRKINTEGQSL